MGHVFQKPLKKRRAISNIIGSLVILAVVASIGSIILFQGLNHINAFNSELILHNTEHTNELREDIIFQHVWFNPSPSSTELVLYLANVGTIDSTISSVSVVKIDTQELVVAREPVNKTILVEDHGNVTLNAVLPLASPQQWNSTEYGPDVIPKPVYKITITTSKGNFFSSTASPFNT